MKWMIRVVAVGLTLGSLAGAFAQSSASAQSSAVCAGCHPNIAESYGRTGMGRSFYRPSPENTVEDYTRNNTYYHQPSDSYFTMLRRDGKYFQRRYQLDAAGKQINVMEKQVDYVMGSGNHARTYLNRTSGNTLVELPLGWYAEKGGYWAMNPGYDRANHDGFRRPITYDCMFCHNAYPKIAVGHEQPLAEPVYAGALPEGIDCTRCHGSGERHVRLAGTAGAKREAVREAIVNPARLSPERQMEGCMVCHLETTSFPLPNALQRFERKAFSFQAGEALGGFLVNFDHAPEAGRGDKFEIVNAAYRLRQSQCFLKSSGKLLCTTCHNPHEIPHGEEADRHYSAVCRGCHAEAFARLVQAGRHTTAAGCAGCHMPKRRTEDVIHIAATDHLIQRQALLQLQAKPGDLLAERQERVDAYRGRVALYYPATLPPTAENELTMAVAQVIQGSNVADGTAQLAAAIAKWKPQQPEYYLALADALRTSGELAKAAEIYREAVRRNEKVAAGYQKLGTTLRLAGQSVEAVEALRKATAVEPERAVGWHELGLAYRALGRDAEAVAAIEKALALDPDLPEAHNNLGIIRLTANDSPGAERSFREAIRIRTDYADAHGNLAGLLAGAGRFEEARTEFEVALRLRPRDAVTRYGYAMLLGQTNRFDDAQRELEGSLRDDPGFADAHLLLGDLLMAKQQLREAAPHYREALRREELAHSPDSGRGHLGLGAALLGLGDREGAIAEFRKAAAGTDKGIRDQAAQILRQLGQ